MIWSFFYVIAMLNEYYNAIRRYIELNQDKAAYGAQLFFYQIGEDEINDASLVSLRAYGTRAHSDVVRIAAGASFSFEPLPQKMILLPSLGVLIKMQKKHLSA